MRPPVIGIGGAYSGVGKTAVATHILNKVKNWGAIKYTRTSLYSSIIDDAEIISEKGKDTKRLLDAGAKKVLWVQSPFSEIGEILPIALEMLTHLSGIIVEGNSAIRIINPDIVVFVSGNEQGKRKKNSEKLLEVADIVIFENEPPVGTPERAQKFYRSDLEECSNSIIKLLSRTLSG
jgi:LAO/AO transport system kinase